MALQQLWEEARDAAGPHGWYARRYMPASTALARREHLNLLCTAAADGWGFRRRGSIDDWEKQVKFQSQGRAGRDSLGIAAVPPFAKCIADLRGHVLFQVGKRFHVLFQVLRHAPRG